jgi:hypothetical protein
VKKGFDGQGDLDTIKEKRTLDTAKKTFAYTTNLEDWRRFIAAINELCLIVKKTANRTFWHIWFCPTHKPTLRKTKRAKIFQPHPDCE